ncbi:DUF6010 family protein [Agrobacterium pusense]|uniref:DUF6010 family protein n=1 Tax=Agrobacterium pusense TaxID=648995 RepID=UPI00289C6384|nr:DUF6010 family protein [Agrobacterium pusense]
MHPHHSHGDHPARSVFETHTLLTSLGVSTATLLPHAFLTPEASLGFAAVVLGLIAGVYFGFAVVNGSARDQMVEFNITGLFTLAGILGLLVWPILLPLAYLSHALWDLAHHNRSRLALVSIPNWYVPWCIVIDVIVGVGLLIIWWTKDLI